MIEKAGCPLEPRSTVGRGQAGTVIVTVDNHRQTRRYVASLEASALSAVGYMYIAHVSTDMVVFWSTANKPGTRMKCNRLRPIKPGGRTARMQQQ